METSTLKKTPPVIVGGKAIDVELIRAKVREDNPVKQLEPNKYVDLTDADKEIMKRLNKVLKDGGFPIVKCGCGPKQREKFIATFELNGGDKMKSKLKEGLEAVGIKCETFWANSRMYISCEVFGILGQSSIL